jgi:hypothetical protein
MIIVDQVRFAYPAPGPDAIAKAITDICGLPVNYASSEYKDDLHEFSGDIFFTFAPTAKIEIRAYKQGAVEEFERQLNLPVPVATMKVEGRDDKDGTQRVYIESRSSELTLFYLTQLALKRTGGTLFHDLDDEAKYDQRITEPEMLARLQANTTYHKKRIPLYALGALCFVATLPFIIVWTFIKAPFRLAAVRRKHPELFNETKIK